MVPTRGNPYPQVIVNEGRTMKGLTVCLCVTLLVSTAGLASTLEMTFSAGPSAVSLSQVNTAITAFNVLIEHLNETFDAHPDVDGSVDSLDLMRSGLALRASEAFRLVDWLAVGGHVEILRSSTATRGVYSGAGESTIGIALGISTIGLGVDAHVRFVDVGLQMGFDLGASYYRTTFDRSVIFEIPEEYPDTLSSVPPAGDARYTASTLGLEFGLTIAYPVVSWLTVHSSISYRAASTAGALDSAGAALDLDGNGQSESLALGGLAVRLGVSINIDLSMNGRKE